MISIRCLLLLAAGAMCYSWIAPTARVPAAAASQLSQEEKDKEEKADGEKKDGDEKKEEPKARPSGFTEEQEAKIIEHFHANAAEFLDSGRLSLHYKFRDQDDVRLRDFLPKIETTDRRIRWASEWEDGVMVAEYGNFVHTGLWVADAKMGIEGTCYSQIAEKDLFVVGMTDEKGRDMIGSNLGEQCVSLRAMAFKDAIPTKMPSARHEQKLNFGFEIDLGVLYCVKDGRRINIDTKSKAKFTRKFTGGRLAVRWNGRIQVCIHELTIEGKLDPKWVDKEIL